MEDARLAKKLVRREVTRVVTPGTAADSLLGSRRIKIIFWRRWRSREIAWASPPSTYLPENFARRNLPAKTPCVACRKNWNNSGPKNCSTARPHPCSKAKLSGRSRSLLPPVQPVPKLRSTIGSSPPTTPFRYSKIISASCHSTAFRLTSGHGAARPRPLARLIRHHYVRSTQRGSLDHVDRIGWYERQNCLVLDAVTVRNLELIEPLFAGADAGVTLFRSIDAAVTPMGKRLLRAWLLRPSLDLAEINSRLDAVEVGVKDTIAREELRRALDGVLDLERLLSRVTLEAANPRDVLALAASLARIPSIKLAVARLTADRLKTLHASLDELADLRERIEKTIVTEPPLSFSDGGIIAAGVDRDLDELRELSRNSKQVLAHIEQRERERTGIGSLKVKFNSIFGYYLEVSKPNLHLLLHRTMSANKPSSAPSDSPPRIKRVRSKDSRCPGKNC